MSPRFAIETPDAPGGVGVVRLSAHDMGVFFVAAGVRPVAVGASGVRRVFGVDEALVARPDERTLLIMPHAGAAIMRSIAAGLVGAGVQPQEPGDPVSAWPEAGETMEARMLAALARAPSPLAVDLLLDQPRRWREAGGATGHADAAVLGRLLTPPVVVAVGSANIGKSSLLNALSGASVALAFDRPGTTRDAVGALVDLGGLVVRWVDTPGVEGRVPGAVLEEIARADLVVRCADANADGPLAIGADHPASMVVATRADAGTPRFAFDALVSARTGAGVAELGLAVREALVPAAALAHPGPWRFWDGP